LIDLTSFESEEKEQEEKKAPKQRKAVLRNPMFQAQAKPRKDKFLKKQKLLSQKER